MDERKKLSEFELSGKLKIADIVLSSVSSGGGYLTKSSTPEAFTPASVVHIDWYNGSMQDAYDALPSAGGTIVLGCSEYINDCNEFQKTIHLLGSGMPTLASDRSKLVPGSGSIIYGKIVNSASGSSFRDFGVDYSQWAVDNKLGGIYDDCFVPGRNSGGSDTTWDEDSTYIRNVFIENVFCLSFNTTNPSHYVHAFLLEHVDGAYINNVHSVFGFHGNVIKSRNVVVGVLFSYGQNGSTLIIKSDHWTKTENVTIHDVKCGNYEISTPSSFFLESQDSVPLNNIAIGNLTAIQCATALEVALAGTDYSLINNIKIDNLFVYGGGQFFIRKCSNFWIGRHLIQSAVLGIKVEWSCTNVDIGTGVVIGCSSHAYFLGCPTTRHGNLIAKDNGGYAVFNEGGNAIVDYSIITNTNNTLGMTNTSHILINSTNLINGWTSSSSAFSVAQNKQGYIRFYGNVISPYSGYDTSFARLPEGYRFVFNIVLNPGSDGVNSWGLRSDSDGYLYISNVKTHVQYVFGSLEIPL